MVLDQGRFLELRDKTSHLTLVTSILLVTYNTVGEAIAGVQSLKTKLKEQICTLLEGVGKRYHLESFKENKMRNENILE